MSFKDFFSKQAQKPSGLFGRLIMSIIFNIGNKKLNTRIKNIILSNHYDRILEIGFGTGKLIYELAIKSEYGIIEGIDLSNTMFKIAKKRNYKFINMGKVIIRNEDLDKAYFNNDTYNLIFSINTIYFWKDLLIFFKKVYDILKMNGIFLISFENMDLIKSRNLNKNIFNFYNNEMILELLTKIGYKSVSIISEEEKIKNLNIIKAIK